MFLEIIITFSIVEILGLAFVYQQYKCNGNKHDDITIIMRNTLIAYPMLYIMLVLIITLV